MTETVGQQQREADLTALAIAFQHGDLKSFETLVGLLSRQLIASAYRYTRDWENARDLCQETWLTVYQSIHRYDSERSFTPWLHAIHRHVCLSSLRRASVRREWTTPSEVLEGIAPADPAPEPDEQAHRSEFMARVRALLRHLSESQRRVFALVDLEQMDQQHAARILDMKPTTLRTTLHFARRRLARLLRTMEGS